MNRPLGSQVLTAAFTVTQHEERTYFEKPLAVDQGAVADITIRGKKDRAC